jgi:hypothetical protein
MTDEKKSVELCQDILAARVAQMMAGRDGYEPFHLTGEQGVLREVEDYLALEP